MHNKPLKETGVSGIEAKTKSYAKRKGCWVRKFSSMSQRGVPDDIIVTPSGLVVSIEFKSPKKLPTHKQEMNLKEILSRSGHAYVVDNLHQDGKTLWKKDFNKDIEIWHNGFALIDHVLTITPLYI